MRDIMEMLILVDEDDREIGYKNKENCHKIPAALHRAFSIFIVDGNGRMLIHKRQVTKKTWPGFWTNACCSHPRKGEDLSQATKRRLHEELGFTCTLEPLFKFNYFAQYNDMYGEREVDHVFLGVYKGPVKPDITEIQKYKFVPVEELVEDVTNCSRRYTPWFRKGLPLVLEHLDRLFF